SAASSADVIYRWRDAQGVLHYSDTPPGEGARDVKMLRVPGQTENRSSNTAAGRTLTPGGRAARVDSGTSTSAGGAPASGGGGAAGGGTSAGAGTSGGGTSAAGGTTASRTNAARGSGTTPSGTPTATVTTPTAPASSPAPATT